MMGARTKHQRGGTVVEEIVASICHGIFRGEHRVGQKLPPLRTLAKTYDVTLPTMQRVIARMEELGVIAVRQGSGVKVLDPVTNAHPAALPYWLEALSDRPSEAVEVLRGFLEMRSELTLIMALKVREEHEAIDFGQIEERLRDLKEGAAEGMTPFEAFEADVEVMRTMLRMRPQLAYSTVLNIFERIVRAQPVLQQAMYDPPSRIATAYAAALDLFFDSSVSNDELRLHMSGIMRLFDAMTLRKFESILTDA
jgi:DNA-binding FadR family transcriptional regulator